MQTPEILEKYLKFYQERGHAQVPNVSLVPEGDSTLLFVNSGMFPLVPYLSGEPHPAGKRLVNVQRAMRFEDLDEVGDYNHTTCFHMIGNWSLGDYFKAEQLPWIYEFFIEVVGLDINKIYATVFKGDQYAPYDQDASVILKEIFAKYGIEAKENERIFAYDDNWWQRGDAVGELGGPDSEVYYYIGEDGTGIGKNPAENEHEFLEIGNSVFIQYQRTEDGWQELPQKNVDFGGGLERIALVSQEKKDIFETDNFWPLVEAIQALSGKKYGQAEEETQAMRIIADHIRAATFLAMDGVIPSNKDQGYALRRFLRRMIRFGRRIDAEEGLSSSLVQVVTDSFAWLYPELKQKNDEIQEVFKEEEDKFIDTLNRAERQVTKRLDQISDSEEDLAKEAFNLYQSLGYPAEMFLDEVLERGVDVNQDDFWTIYDYEMEQHQQGSRKGAEQKFKGGLADQSEQVVRYHTATHLIQAALRRVLGDQVVQHGSNITGERLRFDFNHDRKLTEEEIQKVEDLVDEKIQQALPVNFAMLPKEEAERTGAVHAFGEKYADQVKVYFIGDDIKSAVSKEFCGGPHASNTSEIGPIEIYKQESVGKGIRRLYARSAS